MNLLLIRTAPILSVPRGFGLDVYPVLKRGGFLSLLGFYIWINLIVSAVLTWDGGGSS